MRRMLVWIAAAAVAVTAVATWYLSRRPAREAVFLIVVDTLRADRLSCYGFGGHETPNMDALAARGVVFDNAISVGGWTVPSMGGVLTSLYPTQLGLVEDYNSTRHFDVRERRDQWEYSIADGYTTLAEVLSRAGYQTAAFVNQPVLNNNPGFAQGFSEWFYPVNGDSVAEREDVMRVNEDVHWTEVFLGDEVLVDRFVEWLPGAPGGKLFVWVHLLTPHAPYRPPARYGIPVESNPEQLYNGEVRFADELVGRVVAAIDDEVGLDRSLVVFTSDHGEEFREHGSTDHGHSLHRECVHVPLIMSGPGLPEGRRVDRYVRLLDVMPTILGSRSIDPGTALEGADLAAHIAGSGADLPVHTEGMLYGSTERSLIDGGFRLMWDAQGDVRELFDIGADPGETRDVSQEHPGRVADLRSQMDSHHDRIAAERARFLKNEIVGDSLATVQERRRALNAMRALGYVND